MLIVDELTDVIEKVGGKKRRIAKLLRLLYPSALTHLWRYFRDAEIRDFRDLPNYLIELKSISDK